MGSFTSSLGRELGKNTGKYVSNKVFGDKWSTPYRVSATAEVAKSKVTQAKIQAEAESARIREQERVELEKIDRDILLSISKIQFNSDKSKIHQVLTEMCSLLESYQDTKIKKAAKAKIRDGVFKLKQINANEEHVYFQNILEGYEKQVKLRLNFVFISLGLFLVSILLNIIFSGDWKFAILLSIGLLITTSILYANKIGVNFNKY